MARGWRWGDGGCIENDWTNGFLIRVICINEASYLERYLRIIYSFALGYKLKDATRSWCREA